MDNNKENVYDDIVYIVSSSFRSFHGLEEIINKSVTEYHEFNTFKEAFDFYEDQFYDDSDTHVSKKVGNLFYALVDFKEKDPVWKLYSSNYNDMEIKIAIPILNKDKTEILYTDIEYITGEDLCKLVLEKYISSEYGIPKHLDKDNITFEPYVHNIILTNRL